MSLKVFFHLQTFLNAEGMLQPPQDIADVLYNALLKCLSQETPLNSVNEPFVVGSYRDDYYLPHLKDEGMPSTEAGHTTPHWHPA